MTRRSTIMFKPCFWARVDEARVWLESQGWSIRGKRAYKQGVTSIPAPGSNKYTLTGLYDLHDVAFEMQLGSEDVVRQINEFFASRGRTWRDENDSSCPAGPLPKARS